LTFSCDNNILKKMARNRIDKIYEYVGLRIRYARRNKGLSQDDLAKLSHLERPSIVLIEGGQQKLPIDRLYIIARALEVLPQRLLPDSNDIFSTDLNSSAENSPIILHKSQELKPEAEKEIREIIRKYRKG
jgi:transcriptional regulator with XRE-family HTH domain